MPPPMDLSLFPVLSGAHIRRDGWPAFPISLGQCHCHRDALQSRQFSEGVLVACLHRCHSMLLSGNKATTAYLGGRTALFTLEEHSVGSGALPASHIYISDLAADMGFT